MFDKFGGALPLPVIKNEKTVDPREKKSTAVLQLETAMGAAIECFQGAQVLTIIIITTTSTTTTTTSTTTTTTSTTTTTTTAAATSITTPY